MSVLIPGCIAFAVLALLFFMARKGGKDAVRADIGERDAKTASKVADAVATGPSNITALREQLRDGGKL